MCFLQICHYCTRFTHERKEINLALEIILVHINKPMQILTLKIRYKIKFWVLILIFSHGFHRARTRLENLKCMH